MAIVAASGIQPKALMPLEKEAALIKPGKKVAPPPMLQPAPKRPPPPPAIDAEACSTADDDENSPPAGSAAGIALTKWSKTGAAW